MAGAGGAAGRCRSRTFQRRAALLLGLAALLRLLLLGWDSGLASPHPDERRVAMVAEGMTSARSDPGFYAYGALHFTAVRALAGAFGDATYADALLAGRALSLLASLAALALAALLARRAWGRRAALLTLALGALVPLDLQQSHFATVEAHHAFWVTLALAAAWTLARGGGLLAAGVAGAACGASLAVKVSSLPLAAPLLVAVLLVARRRGAAAAASAGLTATAAAVAAFALAQPSAFTGPPLAAVAVVLAAAVAAEAAAASRRAVPAAVVLGMIAVAAAGVLCWRAAAPAYLQGVAEQLAMASGRWDVPYTRVYHGTAPFLYPARELALWGLGPALAAAAAVAVAAGLRRLTRGIGTAGADLLAILLAWAVPVGLRLATLQVKYLRYWQPLVLPLVLLAAWWLARRPRRWRIAVVGLTAVAGLAYAAGLAAPHPHLEAARWLATMAEPGQVVAVEHWDETLPLDLERVELASYDLPDDAAKAARWAATLEQADWVVLTSHRLRRAVLADPGRYPRTGRLYALLLTGELGFAPVTRVERAPRLLGLPLPVQRADESWVNYEFPRVLILRRVASVTPEAAMARLAEAPPPPPWSRLEARVACAVPRLETVPTAATQVRDAVAWLAVLAAAGAAAWLLLLPWLGAWPDAGAGLALASGWIGWSWATWLAVRLGGARPGPAVALAVLAAALAVAAAFGRRRRHLVRAVLRRRRGGVLAVLAVVLSVGALFLVVRAGNPAVWWGEKPMDMTFLRAFVQAESWPPGEPWLAGEPLHYYYLGEVLAAVPTLAAGASPAVAYNLMAASLPALAAGILAGFGLLLGRAGRWLLPLLALLSGNLAWPWLVATLREGRLFDAWWATSRVIPGFAIDEYPLWTALFADLHAHFLAQPVLLAALAWGLVTVRARRMRTVPVALTGVAAGVLAATNPWDLLTLTVALACGLAAARRPGAGLAGLAAAAAVSVLAAAPWLVDLPAWLATGAGGGGLMLNRADFAPAGALLRHLGLFLLPLGAAAATGMRRPLTGVVLSAAGVALGLALGSPAAALALALLGTVAVAAAGARGWERLAFALGGAALILVAAAERFTLMDRMNTLFKLYNGAWLLLAAALGVLLLALAGRRRRLVAVVWLPLQLVALLNLPLGVAQGWLQPRMPSPRPTLDGEAFLPAAAPADWVLVRALQGVGRPGDVVAEAAGPSYGEHGRLAMHSGLATVVGWEWHLRQRGQPLPEIERRFGDLAELYAGLDPLRRRAVLDRYGVEWVAVGPLERRTYLLAELDPLAGVPGVVEVAREGRVVLYRVLPAALP